LSRRPAESGADIAKNGAATQWQAARPAPPNRASPIDAVKQGTGSAWTTLGPARRERMGASIVVATPKPTRANLLLDRLEHHARERERSGAAKVFSSLW
jgi:hypothetical protein